MNVKLLMLPLFLTGALLVGCDDKAPTKSPDASNAASAMTPRPVTTRPPPTPRPPSTRTPRMPSLPPTRPPPTPGLPQTWLPPTPRPLPTRRPPMPSGAKPPRCLPICRLPSQARSGRMAVPWSSSSMTFATNFPPTKRRVTTASRSSTTTTSVSLTRRAPKAATQGRNRRSDMKPTKLSKLLVATVLLAMSMTLAGCFFGRHDSGPDRDRPDREGATAIGATNTTTTTGLARIAKAGSRVGPRFRRGSGLVAIVGW